MATSRPTPVTSCPTLAPTLVPVSSDELRTAIAKGFEEEDDDTPALLDIGATALAPPVVVRRTRYVHADGRHELVAVVKEHSDAEGGGVTIYVPSIGRERNTVAERLLDPDDTATPSPPPQPPKSPTIPPVGAAAVSCRRGRRLRMRIG